MFRIIDSALTNSGEWFRGLDWYFQGLVLFGFIGIIILLVYLITKFKGFRKIVLDFVVYAEYNITGTKRGRDRFDFVIGEIYKFIPLTLKPILTKIVIKRIIEWAVKKMKRLLSENNVSIDDFYKSSDYGMFGLFDRYDLGNVEDKNEQK